VQKHKPSAKAQAEIEGTSRKGTSREQGHKPKRGNTRSGQEQRRHATNNKSTSRKQMQKLITKAKPRTKPKAENEAKSRKRRQMPKAWARDQQSNEGT
jgi:hypothetical protein